MCNEFIIAFVLNTCTLLYSASRYNKPAKFLYFWLSFAVFAGMAGVFYYQVISDCNVLFTKISAGFLGVDFIILVLDSKPWLTQL